MKVGGYLLAGWLALTLVVWAQPSQPTPVAVDPQAARAAAGAAFLTRLRLADPDYQMILLACLKENELNLLLSRLVKQEEIPILVKGLLGQLSKAFPGQDLSVIAFRPVVPLREAAI